MIHRPNILFIFPDQLSARWLPFYGNHLVHTPNLSQFAAQNAQFNRAYTNVPLCTPYRACLLTGQYPSQTGITGNGMRLPENQPTIAHHLNRAGYDTHYIGKWHLSGETTERVGPARTAGRLSTLHWVGKPPCRSQCRTDLVR